METNQNENNGEQSKNNILAEEVPVLGLLSMLFYIPESVKDRDVMVSLIRENGGNTVKFHEWFTYQIGTPDNTKEEDYYSGTVYSFQWIVDSVEKNEIQEKSKYILANYTNGIEFPFNKKKIQYTIREIIIIYNWISGRKSQASRKTWESLGNDGVLYWRSRESLKNFWKNNRNNTLEDCINDMKKKGIRYCHNYADPIRPHEPLPDSTKKKNKRTKQDTEEQKNGDEEAIETGAPTELKKRKIKKKSSEVEKGGDRVSTSEYKTQKIEEVKVVESMNDGEGDEEPEEDIKAEDTKGDKKEIQRPKKPDEPLETNSVDGVIEGSEHSSGLGFPSLGAASEEGGDD